MTREAEWDESSRGRALRRQEYEDSIDRVTNLPVDEAFKDQPFDVSTVINHAHAAQQRHERAERKALEEKHGKGKVPEGWNDGHRYPVRTLTPDELAKDGRGN